MADTDKYEPCGSLVEFLQLKGSVGMVALLYERSRSYSELESEIEITSSTISRRRKDAVHLGLLTLDFENDEHGGKHVYKLTDLGNYVAERMANKGIVSSYFQMRDRQKEIENKTEQFAGWVQENPSNFIDFEAAREERITPREDPDWPPSELDEVRDAKEDGNEETDTGADDDDDTDRNDTGDQTKTDPGDDSSSRPPSPSDRVSDDVGESGENETQGTFDDITADESEQTDNESDS